MIRQALEKDVEKIGKLMYQIHKVHSDGRPDLFVVGDRKLSDDELKNLIEELKNEWFLVLGLCRNYVNLVFDIKY